MARIIGVYPGHQSIKLTPGETYEGSFSIVNPSDDSAEPVSYTLFVAPYSVIDDQNTPDFDSDTPYSEIQNWITLSKDSGTISSDSVEDISYSISVPSDASAGGQYCAIILRVENESNKAESGSVQISSIQQIANVIFSEIAGETSLSGGVVENKIRSFSMDSPITTSSIVKNTGNVHSDASYVMRVYPLFSDEELFDSEAIAKKVTIFPGSSYIFADTWEGTPALGIFRVTQTVTFLSDISTTSKIVFVCPAWFLITWLVFISACIAWFCSRRSARFHARKNAMSYISKKPSR